jgi:hypothetical protein
MPGWIGFPELVLLLLVLAIPLTIIALLAVLVRQNSRILKDKRRSAA